MGKNCFHSFWVGFRPAIPHARCTHVARRVSTVHVRDGRVLEAPATDRYWIIDVGGRRVVITAMTRPRADSEAIELVTGVAKTTTFVVPE